MKKRRAMILMSRSFEGGDGVFAIKRDCWWERLTCEEKKTSSLPFSFTKTLCQFYFKALSNSFDSPALLSMDSYHLRKCCLPESNPEAHKRRRFKPLLFFGFHSATTAPNCSLPQIVFSSLRLTLTTAILLLFLCKTTTFFPFVSQLVSLSLVNDNCMKT